MARFTEVFDDITKLGTKIPQEKYLPDGLYPIIDQGQNNIAGYSNNATGLFTDTPVIIFGDHTRVLKYFDKPLFLGADGVKLLKPKDKNLNIKYLFYALCNAKIPNTGYNRHFKWLKEVDIPIVAIGQQYHIAAVLDKVSDVIRLRKQQLAKLDDLIKARFVEMFGDVKKREELSTLCINGPQNGFYRKDKVHKPNMPVVKMKELFANKCIANESSFDMVNMTHEEQKRFLLTSDDLLFGRRSFVIEGAGKCRRVGEITYPLTFESSLLRITLDSRKVLPRFVQEWFETDEGQQSITAIRATTTISGIKGSDLKKILLPVPILETQKSFLRFAEHVDQSKSAVQKSLDETQLLFDSLMQKFFG